MTTEKNKKRPSPVLIVLLLTVLVLCFQLMRVKNQNYELIKQLEEVRDSLSYGEDAPSYDELSSIVDSVYGVQATRNHLAKGESFAFVLGTDTCHYCQTYKSETLSQYDSESAGVTLLEIDMNDAFLFENDLNSFIEELGLEYLGTPTTVFVRNGEIIEEYTGVLTLDELTEKLENLK